MNRSSNGLFNQSYPQAYLDFIVHFHGDRDYFECHEILEDYWKKVSDSPRRTVWAGLIQAAVGLYHFRRGNRSGAIKSFTGALNKSDPVALTELGIDAQKWQAILTEELNRCETGQAYQDVNIPLCDTELEKASKERCRELGLEWQSPSRNELPELIHKHKLRDRTEVIAERQRAMARRRENT